MFKINNNICFCWVSASECEFHFPTDIEPKSTLTWYKVNGKNAHNISPAHSPLKHTNKQINNSFIKRKDKKMSSKWINVRLHHKETHFCLFYYRDYLQIKVIK